MVISHAITLLSFPEDKRKEASWGHHDSASTPLLCPCISINGDTELRRSQSCSAGDASSSEATTSCVATSGFHATAEHLRLPAGSLKEITGRCFFKSQTTTVPPTVAVARMCCTLRFHAKQVMSEPCDPGAAPFIAGYKEGCAGFPTSQMHSSPSAAPDARRFGLKGLNSRPRTPPWCFWRRHKS